MSKDSMGVFANRFWELNYRPSLGEFAIEMSVL